MSEFQGIMPLVWVVMIGLSFMVLILLLSIVSLHKKIKRYEAANISFKTYLAGKSIDSLLEEYLGSVQIVKSQIANCSQRLDKIERKLRLAVDRVEMLRFSAFENMGSELSFVIAMLNQDGNGVVLSSINNREETRFYAKPVIAGESNHNLSTEEREVITKALVNEKI